MTESEKTGLPQLEILSNAQSGSGGGTTVDNGNTDQMIVVINKSQWSRLVQLLNIKFVHTFI